MIAISYITRSFLVWRGVKGGVIKGQNLLGEPMLRSKYILFKKYR